MTSRDDHAEAIEIPEGRSALRKRLSELADNPQIIPDLFVHQELRLERRQEAAPAFPAGNGGYVEVPVDQQFDVDFHGALFGVDTIKKHLIRPAADKEMPMTTAEPAAPATSKSLLDLLQEHFPLDWMEPDRVDPLTHFWGTVGNVPGALLEQLPPLIAGGVVFFDPKTNLLHFDPKVAHTYVRNQIRRQEDRPSWDEMGMRTAQLWSERSSDPKVRVGACVLDHWHRVIGVGYNGRAAGEPNERESLDQGQSGFIHAEINALLATNWSDGAATLYVTHEPCASCARAIINTRRIRRVVYGESYTETARTFARLPSGAEIMRAAGLIVERHG